MALARKASFTAVLIAVLVSSAAMVSATTTHRASTTSAGVLYGSEPSEIWFNLHTNPIAGTVKTGMQGSPNTSTFKVLCATFPGKGVAYFGGLGTAGKLKGTYLFAKIVAGGANKGRVATTIIDQKTCYSARNAQLLPPPDVIVTGKITVS